MLLVWLAPLCAISLTFVIRVVFNNYATAPVLVPVEILKGPDTQVTQSGATVWFTCHIIGNPTWVINGYETEPVAYGRFERRGFNFSHIHIGTQEYNLTISIVASLDINNTDIQCQAVSFNPFQVQKSQTAKLVVASESLPNSCILQR